MSFEEIPKLSTVSPFVYFRDEEKLMIQYKLDI
jgi:hypothetical protein